MQSSSEKQVLVLQGGGALGAYQAGAYEALHDNGYEPEWVAGISIGAINGAIIAGNKPENRIERLHQFWQGVSSTLLLNNPLLDDSSRSSLNEFNAGLAMFFGIPGFFSPRSAWSTAMSSSDPHKVSYYDTEPLKTTLEKLVDFRYLNSKSAPRLSVGAVEIKSGNFEYFDSIKSPFSPEHIMASGALPPGFPPIEIGGKYYWDGGLVSNTPLNYIMEFTGPREDMCIFQVDVFSARGELPKSVADIAEREKDIRFSSRTRFNSDHVKVLHELRRTSRALLAKLPKELSTSAEAKALQALSCDAEITIAHIIRRDTKYETGSKDYEFSRKSVDEHWDLGRKNVQQGLKSKLWRSRAKVAGGFQVLDLTHHTMQK